MISQEMCTRMCNNERVKGICTKFPNLWDAKIEKKYMPKRNNYT